MSLTNDLVNMLKNIFLTDLLAAKKKCNNLLDKFNNIKECIINFVDRQMIKNNNMIGRINLDL